MVYTLDLGSSAERIESSSLSRRTRNMIIREFNGLDTSGRNRLFAECKCTVCTRLFTRQKRQLNEYGTCGLQCTNVAKGNSLVCKCDHCGIEFFKAKSKVEASKSGKVFCCRTCKDAAQSYMLEIQPDHYGTGTGEFSYRDSALKEYGYKCMRCGYDKHKAAIVVHHKDHNRANNSINNLEVLCANCHAIHHWG